MSIDKDSFLAGLAVLAGAFSREVDAPVQRAYYTVLSRELTTEEFERAVTITLETETFWPSPAVILSKVKADKEGAAALALEHVNRVTNAHGGFRYLTADVFHREFDAPMRAAISACGGLAKMADADERTVRRRFAKAYQASLQPRIAAPQTDARVKQLVGSVANALTSGRDRAAGRDP